MSTRCHSATPRSRRAERRRRSPKHTSKRADNWSPRRRKSSPCYRRNKCRSSTRYREESTPKDKRSSRGQSYSPRYHERDDDDYKEALQTTDDERRLERATSHPSRVDEYRRSSRRDRRGQCNSDSDYWGRECKISDVMPDCRLRDIEASGGSRNFKKWFGKLPPNCRVDKDVRTDRGIFKKDNFQSSSALDRYLGINSSKSPTDRRRRR